MILYQILTKHIIAYMWNAKQKHRNYVYVPRYRENDMQLKDL